MLADTFRTLTVQIKLNFVHFQNGSVYMPDDDALLEYGKYCVALDVTKDETYGNVTGRHLAVLKCIDPGESEARFYFLPFGKFLAFNVPPS